MIRFTIDGQNRLIFYDNPVGYLTRDSTAAVVDPLFRSEELEHCLEHLQLIPQWEDGVFDRLISGQIPDQEPVTPLKQCRVWQLRPDSDIAMRYIAYEQLTARFGEPDPANYRLVYDGQLGTNDLEEIYTICRGQHPEGYSGQPMSMSDVVELYGEDGSEFYYCDRVGFRPIEFTQQEQTGCHEMTM